MRGIVSILEDIKVQHTVFALPFAIMSAFMAAGGAPGLRDLGLILAAMVFARSAAMAFNRIADERYDRENPRTAGRALPSGRAARPVYIAFTAASAAGFVVVCAMMNRLALTLSPVALGVVLFYSYTKRFTPYSHFFLGAALALAPVGAWVAIREEIAVAPLLLGVAVVFWLAGLDTIYSLQDIEFDRRVGLHSIPQRFGASRALALSSAFHGVMVALLLALAALSSLSWIYITGVLLAAALLYYEHSIVRPDDLSRVNVAFFNVNGAVSMGLMLFTIADVMMSP
ncbi:MAG: UbiA-like polyprenyltransferase [Candidatus Nitrospinota bacterium M3_3B_026]